MQLAINVLKWPGFNLAFMFSFLLTTGLTLLAIPFAKRRPKDRKATWGEAMLASMYTFFVMFLAFGVVPHQWIDHSDKNLKWSKAKVVYGPFDLLKPQALGGHFPMTIPYEAIRDIIVVVIHLWFFGLMIFIFTFWQKRGQTVSKEVATSTYGRPLVKKA